MSNRDQYPAGVPCFVDSLTADLSAARRFYEGIFGWEFAGPGPMPGDPPGEYYVARRHGDDIAGLGTLPPDAAPPAGWNTHIAVSSAAEAAERATRAGGSVLVAPLDVPPAGRLAVIADPCGAPITLWEAGERPGARRINESSAWAMSALATPDPERAMAFYAELLGWDAEPFGDAAWLWRLPGYHGGVPEQPVPRDVVAVLMAQPQGPPAWSVDFWIDSAAAAAEAAPGLGGQVVVAPFEDPLFRRAILAAPDGATFGVSEKLAR